MFFVQIDGLLRVFGLTISQLASVFYVPTPSPRQWRHSIRPDDESRCGSTLPFLGEFFLVSSMAIV